uniref:C3H1-type domain-containing protein n=1 Tax=Mesocestoides corti TaxID=53468 RepID=A0A5K3EQS1_MESCO
MSDTNGKLVPKCISLCIISASDIAVQSLICETDAWDILLKWLQEALKEENCSFLIELMQVYHDLPVTLEQLTRNVCPKLINSLSKRSDNEGVRALAADIVKKWKGVINKNSRKENTEVPCKKRKSESPKKELSGGDSNALVKDAKRRRSTVKVPPTVMRTAGIEEANDQVVPKSRSEVLAKKSKIESVPEKVQPMLPIESFHQRITVTPTEPKKSPHEIHESSSFINALTTSQPVVRKKRKVCKPDAPESTSETDDVRVSLSENVDVEIPEPGHSPLSDAEAPKKSSMVNLSALGVEKKPKKRVSWAPEEKLQQISYFEVDDTERGLYLFNVTRISLAEIRQKEHSLERQLFKRHEEVEIKDAKWYPPSPLELVSTVEPGCKSAERQIQLERERFVLQAIYFTRESIPISPEEPEKEEFEAKLAVEIPLEDLHAKDLLIINDKGDGNSQMSLNPEVADLVKSLALNFNQESNKTPNQSDQASPSVAVTTASALSPAPSLAHPTLSATSPDHITSPLNPDHGDAPMRSDVGPSRIPGPHFVPGDRPPPPHNVVRLRGHPRPPMGGGGPMPYRRPPFPPSDAPPPHFARGPIPPPPFRGPPPPMYGGGRPPMNGPCGIGRRGGRGDQVCKFFQQGNCRNGSNCHFLHPGFHHMKW